MDKEQLQLFIDNYEALDFDKIKFDWNGQHGNSFNDKNDGFRIELCEYIIPQIHKVKLELIRDLYLELAKKSKESWSIYDKFNLFGQELLIRGGTTFLMDYMHGASLSFDTSLSSGNIKINKDIALQLVDYIEKKIENSGEEENTKFYERFKQRFIWLANK